MPVAHSLGIFALGDGTYINYMLGIAIRAVLGVGIDNIDVYIGSSRSAILIEGRVPFPPNIFTVTFMVDFVLVGEAIS